MAKTNKLYETVLEELKSGINSGKYPLNSKLPTEEELSKSFNISRSTLRKVLSTLKDEGYIESQRGSGSFISNKNISRFVPVIFPNRDTVNRITEMLQGIQEGLGSVGFSPLITITNDDGQHEKKLINDFVTAGQKNIIIFPMSSKGNADYYQQLLRQGINLTFVDILPEYITCDYVSSCNFLGGYMATKKLIELGHKKIAFCSLKHPKDINTVNERFLGYISALTQNGLSFSDDLVFIKEKQTKEEFATAIMQNCSKESAIFACTDELALMLVNKMAHSETKIAVCGFDNSLVSESVQLASVNQNFYEIGKNAARLMYERIVDPGKNFEHIYVPVSLVERNSLIKSEPDV